jgi:Cytochrome c.
MRTLKAVLRTLAVLVVLAIVATGVYVWSGAYNVGADVPHGRFLGWLLRTAVQRSVTVHAENEKPPKNLLDDANVARGAQAYARQCAGCHLAPGLEQTVLRAGLAPQPRDLAHSEPLPASETFWVVKHGVRGSGMPAFGSTFDEAKIWAIVAFTQRLPQLTPTQYAAMTAGVAGDGLQSTGGQTLSKPHDGEAGVQRPAEEGQPAVAPPATVLPPTPVAPPPASAPAPAASASASTMPPASSVAPTASASVPAAPTSH